jgi:hypothetical protein
MAYAENIRQNPNPDLVKLKPLLVWENAANDSFSEFTQGLGEKRGRFTLQGKTFDIYFTQIGYGSNRPYRLVVEEDGLMAGFMENMSLIPEKTIFSLGIIGVIDYQWIVKQLKQTDPTRLTPDNCLGIVEECYRRQHAVKDPAKTYQINELHRSLKRQDETMRERVLAKIQDEEPDYRKINRGNNPGGLFRMMCEFVSVLAPEGTLWQLHTIGHRGTARKMAGPNPTPFHETAFGQMMLDSGWRAAEKHEIIDLAIEELPGDGYVIKRPHKIGPEWSNLAVTTAQ